MAGETGDSYYVRGLIEQASTPEAIASDERGARAMAAMIASKTSCEECLAAPGVPCDGREMSVHTPRHFAYVRTGW